MTKFNDRELVLLLNSTHERAMRLLDLSNRMAMVGFTSVLGNHASEKDRAEVLAGHYEHLELVGKIREMRDE